MPNYSLADVKRAEKPLYAWWFRFALNPLSRYVVLVLGNYTRVSPNQVSAMGLLLGLSAAACFYVGGFRWLLTGALLYQFALVLDLVDGKLARLTGRGSPLGELVDEMVNHTIYLAAALAFAAGYADHPLVLWSAALLIAFRAVQMVLKRYEDRLGDQSDLGLHTPIHPSAGSWLARHGLMYPMTTNDREFVIYFIGPISGLIGPMLALGVLMEIALASLKIRRILRLSADAT